MSLLPSAGMHSGGSRPLLVYIYILLYLYFQTYRTGCCMLLLDTGRMLVLICHEVRVPCPPCDYLIQAGPHFRGFKSPRVIGTYQARTSNINIINNSGPVSVARYARIVILIYARKLSFSTAAAFGGHATQNLISFFPRNDIAVLNEWVQRLPNLEKACIGIRDIISVPVSDVRTAGKKCDIPGMHECAEIGPKTNEQIALNASRISKKKKSTAANSKRRHNCFSPKKASFKSGVSTFCSPAFTPKSCDPKIACCAAVIRITLGWVIDRYVTARAR